MLTKREENKKVVDLDAHLSSRYHDCKHYTTFHAGLEVGLSGSRKANVMVRDSPTLLHLQGFNINNVCHNSTPF